MIAAETAESASRRDAPEAGIAITLGTVGSVQWTSW
jgi:hypothetical protein